MAGNDAVEAARALAVLGLDGDASWADIRSAYREQVRRTHPDVDAARSVEATAATARLNVAFGVLARITGQGRRPLPRPDDGQPATGPSTPARRQGRDRGPVTLRTPPGDVFVQFLEAAHEIGDVSYMDPEAGLIQVLLDQGDPAASQLLITLDTEVDPPTASFTLDAPDAAQAPPIRLIVEELAAALRR